MITTCENVATSTHSPQRLEAIPVPDPRQTASSTREMNDPYDRVQESEEKAR
jgi:hypothetical protein